MIPPPSEEQEQFLTALATDHVLGDCVAGSGKTTTVLHVARRFPHLNVIQVTYNAQLKTEVRQKAAAAGLTNLEIHTYHSLALAYYTGRGYDDTMINRLLETDAKPRKVIPSLDILVLDETQDMVATYFHLIRKFLRDSRSNPRLLVLGDRYQGIYGFKGADTRFLTLAPDLWNWSAFAPLTLSTSYRVTHAMAAFVNRCMLGYERLRAVRTGPPVTYVVCNPFAIHKWLANKISGMLESGTKPSDIFVLVNSMKSPQAPVRKLENCLVERGVPCYFPTSDERLADEDILEGKVVFSTFHQAKGRERPVVIVYGFDSSYERNNKVEPTAGCPEALYVAATRASERLILLQSSVSGCGPLSFLQNVRSSPDLSIIHLQSGGKENAVNELAMVAATEKEEVHTETVTNLTRFLAESALNQLTALVGELFVEEAEESYTVPIPAKIATATGSEDVSDINGLVIPAIYEARHCCPEYNQSTIEVDVRTAYEGFCRDGTHPFLRRACEYLTQPVQTVEEFLRLGVMYNSITESVYNRIQQIDRYDWLTEEMVAACFHVLRPHVRENTIFEQAVDVDMRLPEFGRICLRGRMDAVNDDCVWEIKCVETLTVEHFVQVVLYAWIWRHEYVEDNGARAFRLVNIRTGQIWRLRQELVHLVDEVVHLTFHNKWAQRPVLTDAEFLETCREQRFNSNGKDIKSKTNGCLLVED